MSGDIGGSLCVLCVFVVQFPLPMKYKSINLTEKLGLVTELWAPRVIAEMNDYQFKVVKLEGDFVWHSHASQSCSCSKGLGCCNASNQ